MCEGSYLITFFAVVSKATFNAGRASSAGTSMRASVACCSVFVPERKKELCLQVFLNYSRYPRDFWMKKVNGSH